jgi:hypothetical protein
LDAQAAAERLRAAHLTAMVSVDDGGGMLPPLSSDGTYRLLVTAHHREAAEAILAEMEE